MGFVVKSTTLCSILDLLCPHSCRCCGRRGATFCECCKNNIVRGHINYCPGCKREMYGEMCPECELPPTVMLGWREGVLGKAIHDYKYNSVKALGKVLADMLSEIMPAIEGKVRIVPLPTIDSHVRERGFDHTLLLAKQLAKIRGWKVERLIKRAQDTVQVGADEEKRAQQAQKAYKIEGEVQSGVTYVLLDDVWTTGASMRAVTKKLQQAGAYKIIIAVLAVSRTRD